jgi:hypothetical protein
MFFFHVFIDWGRRERDGGQRDFLLPVKPDAYASSVPAASAKDQKLPEGRHKWGV